MGQPQNPHLEKGIYLCGLIFLGLVMFWAAAEYFLKLEFNLPPCLFHRLTGLYCPGCGAGRACYSILHGEFLEAFCYNPLMTVLLPLIGLYIAARMADWIITGENHIDRKINAKFLTWVLVAVVVYGAVRNIPVFPFTLLAPEGLWQIL